MKDVCNMNCFFLMYFVILDVRHESAPLVEQKKSSPDVDTDATDATDATGQTAKAKVENRTCRQPCSSSVPMATVCKPRGSESHKNRCVGCRFNSFIFYDFPRSAHVMLLLRVVTSSLSIACR